MCLAAAVSLAASCSSGADRATVASTPVAATTIAATTMAATTVVTTAAPTPMATTTTVPAPEALCPEALAPFAGLSQVISPSPTVAADGTAPFTFADPSARTVKVTGTWDGTAGYNHTAPMRHDGAG